ncbi:MAG: hypothetical protein K0Q43_1541 [Ramlibacter sp.]|nr:hypothetical protein [Ramlibacter sp.]
MNRMPSLFVSHGAPTFAIEPALAGPLLRQLGRELPRPKAVLVFSPHWMTPGVRVSSTATPETVHDFGGFPAELYRIQYPAPGSPEVAARALELLNAAGWSRALAPLADEGVLLLGSGSITHNLYEFRQEIGAAGSAYASEFVEWARAALRRHDEAGLVNYLTAAPHAQRAHPTPDHYLPLPFAFGAAATDAPVRVLDGGMTYGVLAMDAYLFGENKGSNS